MNKKVFLLFVILLSLMGSLKMLSAQDEFPVLVMSARSSVTVFTNWQLIELTYTVGYLDGYMLMYDGKADPQSMSFGLELDPDLGTKLIRRNQRRYKNENYVDLVYYVRHTGEQKGEVVIPEQVFHYYKEEPGKSREGQEVYETKSLPIRLRYDSVLTKDADDIIDRIDFGSFKRQEQLWKRSVFGLILIMLLVLFWLFRKPVVVRGVSVHVLQPQVGNLAEHLEERLLPKEALVVFMQTVKEMQNNLAEDRIVQSRLANGLRGLLVAFVPDILPSDTPHEISRKVLNLSAGSSPLNELADALISLDGVLYERFPSADKKITPQFLLALLEKLRRDNSRWRRLHLALRRFLPKLKRGPK